MRVAQLETERDNLEVENRKRERQQAPRCLEGEDLIIDTDDWELQYWQKARDIVASRFHKSNHCMLHRKKRHSNVVFDKNKPKLNSVACSNHSEISSATQPIR